MTMPHSSSGRLSGSSCNLHAAPLPCQTLHGMRRTSSFPAGCSPLHCPETRHTLRPSSRLASMRERKDPQSFASMDELRAHLERQEEGGGGPTISGVIKFMGQVRGVRGGREGTHLESQAEGGGGVVSGTIKFMGQVG